MLHWWLNYGPKLAKDGPALFEECYPQGGALTYGEEGIARFVPQMEMAFVVLCPGFFERTLDAFYDVLADLKRCARTFLNPQQPAVDDRYFYAGKPKLIFDPIRSCNMRKDVQIKPPFLAACLVESFRENQRAFGLQMDQFSYWNVNLSMVHFWGKKGAWGPKNRLQIHSCRSAMKSKCKKSGKKVGLTRFICCIFIQGMLYCYKLYTFF